MHAPKNKVEFYERYQQGEFGNRPRTWSTWESLRDSSYVGLVTARNFARAGICYYGISTEDLRAGHVPEELSLTLVRFNESMPDEHLTIQGTAMYLVGGLILEYSCVPGLKHRDATNQPFMKRASGLEAISLLRTYLDPSSFDDMMELFDTFPDAAIEFSTYGIKVGQLPFRNTIFWECRSY